MHQITMDLKAHMKKKANIKQIANQNTKEAKFQTANET